MQSQVCDFRPDISAHLKHHEYGHPKVMLAVRGLGCATSRFQPGSVHPFVSLSKFRSKALCGSVIRPQSLIGAATSNMNRKMAAYKHGLPEKDSDLWTDLDVQHRDMRFEGGLLISVVATKKATCSNTSRGIVSSVGSGLGDWVSIMGRC